MKNIVLIGMPGAGKSTIGVLLAKSMLMDFVDTDLIIQKKYSCSLCDIIEREGIRRFIEIEDEVISECEFENCVIATGGSAVYGETAMARLREKGVTVYLEIPVKELEKRLGNIQTRGVAMKKGTTIEDLLKERSPLYEKYADITVHCEGLTAEECVNVIHRSLSQTLRNDMQ
ncbi:MAG: shikimate kinase [Clostridia bacterium]|nr:shikimate kinase [Clostridia bacterium]